LQSANYWENHQNFIDTRSSWIKLVAMKSLFAILFSFALIVSQAAVISGSADLAGQGAGKPKCCGHCKCCGGQCCKANTGSDSHQPAPAVPSHQVSQNDWQLLVAISVQILPQTPADSAVFFSQSSILPSVTTPLYQRNCSYLI
jgi:hypothetical protein